jgi:hypothetical protein
VRAVPSMHELSRGGSLQRDGGGPFKQAYFRADTEVRLHWSTLGDTHIRPAQESDRDLLMRMAERLQEGVAPWRYPEEVHHAVIGWVRESARQFSAALGYEEEDITVSRTIG